MHYSEAIESVLRVRDLLSKIIVRPPAYFDEHYITFLQLQAGWLKRATPYFWTADIEGAVQAASIVLPSDTVIRLEVYAPRSPEWWWFERPLKLRGVADPVHAMLWASIEVPEAEGGYGHMVAAYGFVNDLLQPIVTLFINNLQNVGGSDNSPTPLGEEHVHETEGTLARWFFSALLWMDQKIVVAHETPPHRSLRRRLQRANEPVRQIRVITLRRASRETTDGTGGSVDWTCRWIVGGHWRQQPYPSTGERRPLWIMPYVKGPEDKPLNPPSATVFAVRR